jgi:hypothetical protein
MEVWVMKRVFFLFGSLLRTPLWALKKGKAARVISAGSSSIANRRAAQNPWGPGDQNSHAAAKTVGGNPGFVGTSEVLSALFNRGFDQFAPRCRNAFDVQYSEGHAKQSL